VAPHAEAGGPRGRGPFTVEDKGPRGQESFTRADFLRRLALAGLSAGLLAEPLAGCSDPPFEPYSSILLPRPTPSPAGVVRLLAPPGAVDPAVLRAFSRRTGVAVRPAALTDGVTLPETLSGDAVHDVVLAPDRLVPELVAERLLRPLDMMLVGNFDYVQGAFRAPPYDYGDPARYSVPYRFRTLGLAVRPGALEGAPRAWTDLWEPGLVRRVRFEVRGPAVVGVGLLSSGFPLGSTDGRHIALAVARLIALRANLQSPGSTPDGAPVTVCWSPRGRRLAGAATGGGSRFILPADGFEIDTDVLCVARASLNPVAAHAFLDFCLRPGVQRRIALRYGTQSVEPEAWLYLPARERAFARDDLHLVHGQWVGDQRSFGALYDRAWVAVAREWGVAA